jgi:hypothetical protein
LKALAMPLEAVIRRGSPAVIREAASNAPKGADAG